MFSPETSRLREIPRGAKDDDAVQQSLERFEQDGEYVQEHRQDLLRQYPDMCVAVYNQQVVGAAKTIDELVTQLKEAGLVPGHVYHEYLSYEEDLLILASIIQ
jgi:hypothetical protein